MGRTETLLIKGIFLDIVCIGDDVLGDVEALLLGFSVLLGVEEMAADEGRVIELGIGTTVLVGTVEGSAHLSFARLLVYVDCSDAGTAVRGLWSQGTWTAV